MDYTQAYKKLNTQQKKAVDTIDGPVMVIAGPGTGKTHVLTTRIAHILKHTDTPPYAILALTFTDSAAVHMRDRIVDMIGKEGYYVNIQTFHAFCASVIKDNPEYFPIDRKSKPINQLEQYNIYEKIFSTNDYKAIKPLHTPYFYIYESMKNISQLKKESVSPEQYKKIIEQTYGPKNRSLDLKTTELQKLEKHYQRNLEQLDVYEKYEQSLREKSLYDFDDMVGFVVKAFAENEILLRDYQEKLHYFLVDEYQDANAAQNNVLTQLAEYWGENANVFVVGDPHQSIYRFQGASIENSLSFVKHYPHAEIITLTDGYRSGQSIYDAAHTLIQNNTLTQEESLKDLHAAVSTKLNSINSSSGDIFVAEAPSQTLEYVYIVETIQKLREKGEKLEDIAVIYRHNKDAVDIQHVLEKWNIPYEIEGGQNILENEEIRQFLQYLRVMKSIAEGGEDERLFEIMLYPWTDIDTQLAMKIARSASRARLTIYELIKAGYDTFKQHYPLQDVTDKEFKQAIHFVQTIEEAITKDASLVFTEFFEYILRSSGYFPYVLQQDYKIEAVMNMNSLYREVKALVSENHEINTNLFLQAVDTMFEHAIHIQAEDLNIREGVVHLSTAHKAKGREWKYVFVLHAVDKKWGNNRSVELIRLPEGIVQNTDISKKEKNEDERRLFYVAITRAIKAVYISFATTNVLENRTSHNAPSMFISEIEQNVKKDETLQSVIQSSESNLEKLILRDKTANIVVSDRTFFAELVKDITLSPTTLNTYLRDSQEFIENILLKVPRAKKPHLSHGTAVHKAFEDLYTSVKNKEIITQEEFIQKYAHSLKYELLKGEDYDSFYSHGKEILTKYYEEVFDPKVDVLYVERTIGSGFGKAILGDIRLSGRLDRVDRINADEKTARVIDYKTGSPKTVGDIEGKTVAAGLSQREQTLPDSVKGPYKRQLLFYALLAKLDRTFPYTITEGEFDFIKPDYNGKHISRRFTIHQEDIKDLEILIKDVMHEIRTLAFLDA